MLENELLEAPFFEEEIRLDVLDSYAKGAPSTYGFPFFFTSLSGMLLKQILLS